MVWTCGLKARYQIASGSSQVQAEWNEGCWQTEEDMGSGTGQLVPNPCSEDDDDYYLPPWSTICEQDRCFGTTQAVDHSLTACNNTDAGHENLRNSNVLHYYKFITKIVNILQTQVTHKQDNGANKNVFSHCTATECWI